MASRSPTPQTRFEWKFYTLSSRGGVHSSSEDSAEESPDESLDALIGAFITRNMQAGEELFKGGADADAMYLVVSGQIEMKLVRRDASGAEKPQ